MTPQNKALRKISVFQSLAKSFPNFPSLKHQLETLRAIQYG